VKPLVPRVSAEQDIDDAVDYYAFEAGTAVANDFIATLEAAYDAISERPRTGSSRYADLLGIPGVRVRKLARYPYLIFYIELAESIDVWRIMHAQRDIPAELGAEPDQSP
jgi:toxin ParE1/3/4